MYAVYAATVNCNVSVWPSHGTQMLDQTAV